eukprot:TRINITY_DN4659_c0_g1_i1.p3 TRINITY_DN4659_c0_g1~~TRINITY_DN4659_c0_g1_i1.p3  ORF type:complete len:134 (+),score=15.29 TRINITY_DN4659_c0_g1_i1:127-528(+)
MSRNAVLRSYRELVRVIARLPSKSEQSAALKQAKAEVLQHATAPEEQVADLLRVMVSKIAFLRMKVPRRPRDAGRIGVGHYIVRDGNVVEGAAAAQARVADGRISNEEAWSLHRKLMNRQYFGQEAPRVPYVF